MRRVLLKPLAALAAVAAGALLGCADLDQENQVDGFGTSGVAIAGPPTSPAMQSVTASQTITTAVDRQPTTTILLCGIVGNEYPCGHPDGFSFGSDAYSVASEYCSVDPELIDRETSEWFPGYRGVESYDTGLDDGWDQAREECIERRQSEDSPPIFSEDCNALGHPGHCSLYYVGFDQGHNECHSWLVDGESLESSEWQHALSTEGMREFNEGYDAGYLGAGCSYE